MISVEKQEIETFCQELEEKTFSKYGISPSCEILFTIAQDLKSSTGKFSNFWKELVEDEVKRRIYFS